MANVFAKVLPKEIGWEPYAHLVWLVFLLFQPLSDPTWTRLDWLYTVLMVALFLPVYLWTWRQQGRRVLLGIVGMSLLGLLFVYLNSGASAFFIYAAAAAGFSGPPRFAFKVVVGIWVFVVVSAFLSSVPWPYVLYAFVLPLVMTAIIGSLNIFEAEKERANAKLHLAHEEIERLAKVAERERIARDLHDLLGHTLSVITLKSDLASRLTARDPVRAEREMAEVARVSREALKEVRETVRGYRARDLEGELSAAKAMLGAAGVRLEYLVQPLTLTPAQEETLALALREAVTNVVRHAQATRCTVQLEPVQLEPVRRFQAESGVRLVVSDNGTGSCAPDGAGLSGMRERTELLGGQLQLNRSPAGTQLVLTLPTSLDDPLPAILEPT